MDETNLAEITFDAFPGERLVVCRNPLVAASGPANAQRSWTPPNRSLQAIQHRVDAGTLVGADQIGWRSAR